MQRWAAWGLSAAPVMLLTMSAMMKFVPPAGFDEGMKHMGWPMGKAVGLGMLELACTAVYLVPRTSVLGAILLTGYLGGATATHVRVDDPFFVQPLLGAMLWGGLYFRNERVRALLPLVTK